jgi:cyclic pyranopterin phosphate synthase
MKDSFERRIDYLRVSITDKCNLKCLYCIPDKGLRLFRQSEILTSDEITRFVRVAHKFGVKKVRITGGEPLMRSDIISLVSSIKDIGIKDLSITTNGILLTGMAKALKKEGLDRVNVSLDTLDAQKYKVMTRGGDIRHVWKALEEAERVGLSPIKVNVVPMRGINDEEIAEFAALTFDKDYHIRFIEFMPVGGNKFYKDACVRKEEIMKKVSSLGTLNRLEFKGGGPSRNYQLKGAKGVIGFISPVSDHFCDFCNRLRLTADGRIKPCLLSNIEFDIRTPMRRGASDEELEDVFRRAVAVKPAGHGQRFNAGLVSMSKIGG